MTRAHVSIDSETTTITVYDASSSLDLPVQTELTHLPDDVFGTPQDARTGPVTVLRDGSETRHTIRDIGACRTESIASRDDGDYILDDIGTKLSFTRVRHSTIIDNEPLSAGSRPRRTVPMPPDPISMTWRWRGLPARWAEGCPTRDGRGAAEALLGDRHGSQLMPRTSGEGATWAAWRHRPESCLFCRVRQTGEQEGDPTLLARSAFPAAELMRAHRGG